MTVEAFQELANKVLTDYTKDKEGKYGWTAWWPEHTLDIQTVVFDYRATLWESAENYLVDTILMEKNLSEEKAVAHITQWLDEHIN